MKSFGDIITQVDVAKTANSRQKSSKKKEGHFLINDAVITFYLQLYGVSHRFRILPRHHGCPP